jgi:hypothetical protein
MAPLGHDRCTAAEGAEHLEPVDVARPTEVVREPAVPVGRWPRRPGCIAALRTEFRTKKDA